MSDWHEYIAAGLLNAVSRETAWVPESLAELFFQKYGVAVQADEISAAADMLADCGIGYAEVDPFAGQFIKISRSRCRVFLAAVEEERDPLFKGHAGANASRIGVTLSGTVDNIVGKRVSRPNLAKYNKYPIIKRYHEFGRDFIEKALQNISTQGYENGIVPASDRIVVPSDNQDAYDQSVSSLEHLEAELKTSNEAGDIFGDNREVIAQEISTLQNLIVGARVRAEPALAFAKKCLGWIVEKAGAATIGELAKRALASLIAWLS